MKFGKLSPEFSSNDLLFKDVLRAVRLPDTYDSDVAMGQPIDNPMFMNDQLGDCVIAGRAHQTRRFELKEQKKLLPITDEEVQAEYFKETGGVDTGLIVSRSLRRWRVLGWTAGGGNYKIKAYSRVSLYNRTQIKAAIYSNLGVGIGFAVPQSAMDQFDNGQPWDVILDDGDILGGHYVYITAYNPVGLTCVTWGKRQIMTWPFFDKYIDEVWAIIDASNDSRRKLLLDLSVVDRFLAKIGQ